MIENVTSRDTTEPLTDAQARRLANRPDLIHYIGALSLRVGVWSFVTFLEHRHFPPDSTSNQSFRLCLKTWMDAEWVIVSIPKRFAPVAEELMATLGLRAANGIPQALQRGNAIAHIAHRTRAPGYEIFPNFDTESCFTLEYTVKNRHFLYNNNPKEYAIAKAAEKEAVMREIVESRARQAARAIRL